LRRNDVMMQVDTVRVRRHSSLQAPA
jgi:hypothetical protein